MTPAQPHGSEHHGSCIAASAALYRGSPSAATFDGMEAVGVSLMVSPPPDSTRWNVDEDQVEQGNFGVPNLMFPQSKVRWLKNKGVIKEDPFSQGSLAHHSCKHGTR